MILIWWYISDFFNLIWESFKIIVDWFEILIDIFVNSFSFIADISVALPIVFIFPVVALASLSLIYKFLGRGDQS